MVGEQITLMQEESRVHYKFRVPDDLSENSDQNTIEEECSSHFLKQ